MTHKIFSKGLQLIKLLEKAIDYVAAGKDITRSISFVDHTELAKYDSVEVAPNWHVLVPRKKV